MKLFILIFICMVSLFGSELEWSNDYKKALVEAKKAKKDIYVLITSANCRWCRKFESTTLQDEAILQTLQRDYITIHLDRDLDYMPEKFLKKRVPRHYFVTSKEEIIYTFLGYWNSEDFISYLADVKTAKTKKSNKRNQE